jgi:hypothetical protein
VVAVVACRPSFVEPDEPRLRTGAARATAECCCSKASTSGPPTARAPNCARNGSASSTTSRRSRLPSSWPPTGKYLRFFEKTVAEAGDATNVRVARHFTVRSGLIVRFEQFVDTALVRDAATA